MILAGGEVRDPAIIGRFIELAGGPQAPVVLIPTASGARDIGPSWPGLTQLREAGLKDVTLLHTYDREVADTEEFVAPLRQARGVWFDGGRQWRLADSYMNTRTHEELRALLERGGVIAGSSAGATIQGSYLARGDSETNTIMMGDHEEGLSLLRGVAVDQHVLKRNRHFDMLEIIARHPELLGIGIDENTALVVRGDQADDRAELRGHLRPAAQARLRRAPLLPRAGRPLRPRNPRADAAERDLRGAGAGRRGAVVAEVSEALALVGQPREQRRRGHQRTLLVV